MKMIYENLRHLFAKTATTTKQDMLQNSPRSPLHGVVTNNIYATVSAETYTASIININTVHNIDSLCSNQL